MTAIKLPKNVYGEGTKMAKWYNFRNVDVSTSGQDTFWWNHVAYSVYVIMNFANLISMTKKECVLFMYFWRTCWGWKSFKVKSVSVSLKSSLTPKSGYSPHMSGPFCKFGWVQSSVFRDHVLSVYIFQDSVLYSGLNLFLLW